MSFDFSTVTYDKFVDTAEKLVEEKGKDFVYTRPNGSDCVYVEKNDGDNSEVPSCIVGQIFFRLGMPISELESWDHASYGSSATISQVLNLYSDPLDHKSGMFLETLQTYQDRDYTWAASLETALKK